MIVCRLCLTASTDVIHIFREYGIQLKVSSILSKHFGSLFEVTEEHDEAICSSCWAHTESFHAFYQSIKSAQNCYSSEDEDDGCQPDGQQNVKIIMYDSVTNEVIEQRHDGSSDHQHHSHQLQQPSDQQQHHYQVDGGTTTTVSTGYETFEVCEQTTDSSDLDLLMMMHPNDGGVPTTDDNGHQHQQHPHQQHMVSVNEHGLALDVDEVDDDQDEGLQQHHHEQQQHQTGMGMDPIMGSVSHRTDTSSVMSEFLQNNEHITVIEVSSPSQAQKLLQQQQQQQVQLQQQQHPQQSRQPPPLMHHATATRIVQRPFATSSTTSTTSSLMPNNADALAMRKRKMPTSSPVTVPNAPAVGTIVQRKQPPPGGYPHQRYVDLSDPESPPDTPNTSLDTSTGSAIMSPSYTSTGGGGSGSAGAEPYRMQCDLCSKTFKTFHRVQTHYQMKHNMNGYVMCCGDQFFEKDLLVDHILMHVNNRRQMKKISCAHCEQFFYRKRFYTRHLLKVHNIGTVGNGSEPDSPTAAATQAPVTLSTSSTLTTTPPTAIPLHCSGDGIVASLPATTTASQSTVRPAHIIRRVINAPATTIGTTIVAGGNSGQSQMQAVNSGTKMPMIVNIQSIVPKSRTSTMAMTAPTQTSTRMIASVNNGGGAGGGLMSNVDVKFELKDVKDDMILGS